MRIRTRLALAFAVIGLLACLQFLLVWWGANQATLQAERSVVAARLLAAYQDLSANKQRLKVWFARGMLSGDDDPVQRDLLLQRMRAALEELQSLSDAGVRLADPREAPVVALLAENLAAMEGALQAPLLALPQVEDPAAYWDRAMLAFDEVAGEDIRPLLAEAIERQQQRSRDKRSAVQQALEFARRGSLLSTLAVLLLAAVAAVAFARRLDRPLAELSRLAGALGAGDYSARSRLSGGDELSRVAALLDSMAERVAQAHARDAELQQRLEDLVAQRTRSNQKAYEDLLELETRRRRFLAELSHELRTPATVIRGEAEVALRLGSDAAEALVRIADAAAELASRVQQLMDAARGSPLPGAASARRVDLAGVLRGVVEQMQALAEFHGLRLLITGLPADAEAEVEGDPERLQQAMVTLLDNAIRYTPEGGSIEVGLAADGDGFELRVDDTGIGMAEEEIEHAFETAYRGREAARLRPDGAGLGLSIARRIAAAHRGVIELHRLAAGGLSARLWLPAAESRSSSEVAPQAADSGEGTEP